MLKLKTIVFSLCLFALTAAGIAAQPPSNAKKQSSANSNAELKFEFPEVEGWQRSEITRSPMGDIANYDSAEGGRITVYFLQNVLKEIPKEERREVLEAEMEGAKFGIMQVGKLGLYKNIEEGRTETFLIESKGEKINAMYALFYFTTKADEEMASEIYLFSHGDDVFKIRASRAKEKQKNNQAVDKFFTMLSRQFMK